MKNATAKAYSSSETCILYPGNVEIDLNLINLEVLKLIYTMEYTMESLQ